MIPVHLYGHPADMDPILDVAGRRGIAVLEDACQAHGARYKGRAVGSLGQAGALSFYPTKNLGAFGDGGALVTTDGTLADRFRQLRNGGQKDRYHHEVVGVNSRLDEMQAALLRVGLRHLRAWTARRRELAERYTRGLVGLGLALPAEQAWAESVHHLYVVRHPAARGRDERPHREGHRDASSTTRSRSTFRRPSLPSEAGRDMLPVAGGGMRYDLLASALPGVRRMLRSIGSSRRCGRLSHRSRRGRPVIESPVLVVVPTYNERDNIVPLVRGILAQGPDVDVWVADDGSPDGTADAVRPLVAELPGRVGLLERSEKGGRGAAVLACFRQGLEDPKGYQVFFEMDADFSHHPDEIPKFREKLASTDMVIGSRYIPGGGSSDWGFWRPLSPGWPIATSPSWRASLCAIRRAAIAPTAEQVLVETEFDRIKIRGYVVHGEMAYQAWVHGFRLGEVPIHFKNRARAASKLSGEEIYTALLNFALLRFRYGFRPRKRQREE